MTDAKTFHSAMKMLAEAETAHQLSLDAIDHALTARRPGDVPKLRAKAQKTEERLSECLHAAQATHRGYWLGKKIKMIPELHRMARLALEFDVISRASGDGYVNPWKLVVDTEMHKGFPHADLVTDVPLEAPGSDLLFEERGAWRA
ncbi:hypothetical protein [Hydrogenophaga sp.]|uniref:hypothetical protein n=1 Tax=Hydrogenophaga sp. TaxID=1904254 RepID=UPI002AB90AA1|nr:hypothetical protein [Hydrogenophaga sp.]MDZ4397980.1 hypothetical protein [Hydrogenophaga sp.]